MQQSLGSIGMIVPINAVSSQKRASSKLNVSTDSSVEQPFLNFLTNKEKPKFTIGVSEDSSITRNISNQKRLSYMLGHFQESFVSYDKTYEKTHVYLDLLNLLNLENNWDGYGASKISKEIVTCAFEIILNDIPAIPSISPTASNSIVLSYRRNNSELLIELFENHFGYAIIENDFSSYHEESNIPLNKQSINSIVRYYYGMRTFSNK